MTHPMAETLQNIADPWFREISESSNIFMYFSFCEYIFQGLLYCVICLVYLQEKNKNETFSVFPLPIFAAIFLVHLEKCNVLGL